MVLCFNPLHPESLNLDMSIVANRDVSQKSKQKKSGTATLKIVFVSHLNWSTFFSVFSLFNFNAP